MEQQKIINLIFLTINNVGFEYDDWALENEYEERCFEDITDIGKYIFEISIFK